VSLAGCGSSGGQVPPAPSGSAASTSIASLPAIQAAKGSVVSIVASGCNPGWQSTGWVAPGGLVVTGADPLAGARRIEVSATGNGTWLAAKVVALNTGTDVAILRVSGLHAKPLALEPAPYPQMNTPAAIVNYLGNAVEVDDAQVETAAIVNAADAYGRPVDRTIVGFTTGAPDGLEGGPLLDADGKVIAMEIGTFPDGVSAAVPDLPIKLALSAEGPASTGTCPAS
jgi:S1-C subfamily serine protease